MRKENRMTVDLFTIVFGKITHTAHTVYALPLRTVDVILCLTLSKKYINPFDAFSIIIISLGTGGIYLLLIYNTY